MTRLKLYHESWLVPPASFRQALDLETNAVLEAGLVDGAVVPREMADGWQEGA